MAGAFLDTNVLVYAFDRSTGDKHRAASDLLAQLVDSGAATISVQVLQELFVTVTRKIPRPLHVDEAAGLVGDLAALAVHRPGAGDVAAAIALHQRHGLPFWDAMILRSAAAMACDVLWSEDLANGHAYDTVVVRSPFA